jgi:hypothetical protein
VTHRFVWVFISLGIASPALSQQRVTSGRQTLRTEVIGCYALYFERGRVDGSLSHATPSVRLDSALWRRWEGDSAHGGRRLLTALSANGRPNLRLPPLVRPQWIADSLTDSVRFSFNDGFSGAEFVLNAAPGQMDTLRGRVFEHWNTGPFQTSRGPAYALRQPCRPERTARNLYGFTTERRTLRADVVGCYALYSERGRVDSSLYNATPSVRLDTTWWVPWPGDSGKAEIRSLRGFTAGGHPISSRPFSWPPHWSADSLTDSLRLWFGDGLSGAVFLLNAARGRTDTLRGRVYESWDFRSPTARGQAYAVREACPP